MLVKICGITRAVDALASAEAGADMLGLVFAKSPRRIEVEKARRIINQIPYGTAWVGVFQDQTLDETAGINELLGLDYIQLHGREPPEFCNLLFERTGAGIIKAVNVKGLKDLDDIKRYSLDCVSFILLDSQSGEKGGGTGRTFPWEEVEGFDEFGKPLIVAGGLNCFNVREAIRRLAPAGVDVSSGVEVDNSPGIKDISLVRRFISEAKAYTTR
ncbi:MAG: N-(5'-phosphoribosyl)anthranilate isomerase [Candidatus Glassbacteria bacterium]